MGRMLSRVVTLIGALMVMGGTIFLFYAAPDLWWRVVGVACLPFLYWLYNQRINVPRNHMALQLDSDSEPYQQLGSGGSWIRPFHSLLEVDGSTAVFSRFLRQVEVSAFSDKGDYNVSLTLQFTLLDVVGLFRQYLKPTMRDWPEIRQYSTADAVVLGVAKAAARQILSATLTQANKIGNALGTAPAPTVLVGKALEKVIERWSTDEQARTGEMIRDPMTGAFSAPPVNRTNAVPYHLWFSISDNEVVVTPSASTTPLNTTTPLPPRGGMVSSVPRAVTSSSGTTASSMGMLIRNMPDTITTVEILQNLLARSTMINVQLTKMDVPSRIKLLELSVCLTLAHPPKPNLDYLATIIKSK